MREYAMPNTPYSRRLGLKRNGQVSWLGFTGTFCLPRHPSSCDYLRFGIRVPYKGPVYAAYRREQPSDILQGTSPLQWRNRAGFTPASLFTAQRASTRSMY